MLEKRYDEDKTKPKHENLNKNKIEPFHTSNGSDPLITSQR
jgi:hypothetical protein